MSGRSTLAANTNIHPNTMKRSVVHDENNPQVYKQHKNVVPESERNPKEVDSLAKKMIKISELERSMDGAPVGDLFEIDVKDDSSFVAFDNLDVASTKLQELLSLSQSAAVCSWADKFESVEVIRRVSLFHPTLITAVNMGAVAQEVADGVNSLRSSCCRNALLATQGLFRNVPYESRLKPYSHGLVTAVTARIATGPKFVSRLAVSCLEGIMTTCSHALPVATVSASSASSSSSSAASAISSPKPLTRKGSLNHSRTSTMQPLDVLELLLLDTAFTCHRSADVVSAVFAHLVSALKGAHQALQLHQRTMVASTTSSSSSSSSSTSTNTNTSITSNSDSPCTGRLKRALSSGGDDTFLNSDPSAAEDVYARCAATSQQLLRLFCVAAYGGSMAPAPSPSPAARRTPGSCTNITASSAAVGANATGAAASSALSTPSRTATPTTSSHSQTTNNRSVQSKDFAKQGIVLIITKMYPLLVKVRELLPAKSEESGMDQGNEANSADTVAFAEATAALALASPAKRSKASSATASPIGGSGGSGGSASKPDPVPSAHESAIASLHPTMTSAHRIEVLKLLNAAAATTSKTARSGSTTGTIGVKGRVAAPFRAGSIAARSALTRPSTRSSSGSGSSLSAVAAAAKVDCSVPKKKPSMIAAKVASTKLAPKRGNLMGLGMPKGCKPSGVVIWSDASDGSAAADQDDCDMLQPDSCSSACDPIDSLV